MIGTKNAARRTRATWAVLGLVGLMGGLVACGDDDDDITGPVGVVTTVRDQAFNFTTLHTFAMPDTVVQFVPLTGSPLVVSRNFDRVALNEVRANLLARGYTQVSNAATTRPDFVVLVGSTATTNYNAYATTTWFDTWGFYTGWGWYAPGFNSSWTLVYPWYTQVGVTAYDRGTLVVTVIPTVTVNPLGQSINASWAGVASALLNGEITSTTVASAVDEMFQQSPYLTNTATVAYRGQ